MSDLKNIDSGTMLMVDKPIGWTSFDVVNKIRYAIRKTYGLKKIKVGHAGTLDPMATGLLIICTGKMTKTIDTYQGQTKYYEGSFDLGATTPTYDRESEVSERYPYNHITSAAILSMANEFTGIIAQKPPIYSAIKKKGVPLYQYARTGKLDVEIPIRKVEIHSFEVTGIKMPTVTFKVSCSKGTYIRSLAHDFGKGLNSGAYLTSLRRTAIGSYHVGDAWQLEELITVLENSKL